jgi:hypothetical protein
MTRYFALCDGDPKVQVVSNVIIVHRTNDAVWVVLYGHNENRWVLRPEAIRHIFGDDAPFTTREISRNEASQWATERGTALPTEIEMPELEVRL